MRIAEVGLTWVTVVLQAALDKHLTRDRSTLTVQRMIERIAVVGSGVSGLTAAYLLSRVHEVTIYEAQDRLGGHAHTQTVTGAGGQPLRVDTGFIVHNDRTYPHLLKLFRELRVATSATEMSMSITDPRSGMQYAGGRGVRGFLARPRQLASPAYLRLLASIRRFHRFATDFLSSTADDDLTSYGDVIAGFPDEFIEWYAIPLVSCVWSSGRGDALTYPARYLFEFLQHHGMLEIGNSPQWRVVDGGSATYVEAIARQLQCVRRASPVTYVRREPERIVVAGPDGRVDEYDRIVIATHADEALDLLADPSPAERELLGAFKYSRNDTVLHTDSSLMPTARQAQASWNYRVTRPEDDIVGPLVTYWMNRLQHLDSDTPLYVTLNGEGLIDPSTVLARMEYDHPIHDRAAVLAQRRRHEITTARTAYAGAHWGWGFHEDGARSGVEAAEAFGVTW